MRQETTKVLYSLHAWTGIVTGVLLFVICFSGAIVVFKHEIDTWANPIARAAPRVAEPVGYDAVLRAVGAHDARFTVDTILRPTAQMPAYIVFGKSADGARLKLAARADTGAVLGPMDSELGQFLRTLHVFLFFGPRWIVGFMGVVMLALIVTGVLVHQKVLKDLYTLRWRSSLRLLLSDAHKAIGVWALLFHILIAFTGAWLGLAPVFIGAMRQLAAAEAPAPVVVASPAAPRSAAMPSLDALERRAGEQLPDVSLVRVNLSKWGREDAEAAFSGPAPAMLGAYGGIRYRAVDQVLIDRRTPDQMAFWSRFTGLMEPLHYGDFGGLTLKWLYFILGLSPALLSITGTWLWLDRQRSGTAAATA